MNEQTNTIVQPANQQESTYALLIRSEEKSRNLFEVVVYPLLILGPLIAIWQFAQQPVNIPAAGWKAWIVSDACTEKNISGNEFHTPSAASHPEIKG
jgi:hypothetical protein